MSSLLFDAKSGHVVDLPWDGLLDYFTNVSTKYISCVLHVAKADLVFCMESINVPHFSKRFPLHAGGTERNTDLH